VEKKKESFVNFSCLSKDYFVHSFICLKKYLYLFFACPKVVFVHSFARAKRE